MAGSSRVGAVDSAGGAPPPGRMILLDSRAYSADHPVEGVYSGPSVAFDGYWRSGYDDGSGRGSYGQRPRQDGGSPGKSPFTALMARRAASCPASEVQAADLRVPPPVFLTDLLHGIGVYEFNMRVFAGTTRIQGNVVNRYS